MRIPRIYQKLSLAPGQEFLLDASASRHLNTVLRLEKGHKIILFNGDGNEYPAHILEINRQKLRVHVEALLPKNRESSLNLHLGQVISKGERMDMTLQKATELGVTAITPLFSSRCEVHLKGERQERKIEHWQRVIISSCEQCGRNRIPSLNTPIELLSWLNKPLSQTKILLDHRSNTTLKDLQTSQEITILVGPEGGLSLEEKQAAEKHGFQALQLGPRIFRTETAGLAAISILQWLKGDFGNS